MNAIDFTLYTKENAPEGSREMLEAAETKFGFIPNVLRQMAESPAVLAGTLQLMALLDKSTLTPQEQWTTLLVVALQNTSGYCVAANSTVSQMMGVPEDVIQGIRRGEPLSNPRFEALRRFTAEAVCERGQISQETIGQFLAAGFTKTQVIEVILAIALETIASYTDRVMGTPMDEQYQANLWSRPATAGAA